MGDGVLGFVSNSWIEQAFRFAFFLITASLLIWRAVRLSMSAALVVRTRARKEWHVEPVASDEQSRMAQLQLGEKVRPLPEHLLSEEVQRLLERNSTEKPQV